MTFEATIRFDDDDMNETISRIVKEAIFENSSFASEIAEEIATYLAGDISDTLMEGSQFADLVEMKIEKAIDEDLKNRLEQMSNTINSQAIAISQLTKSMNAMQSKKFWKKLVKK